MTERVDLYDLSFRDDGGDYGGEVGEHTEISVEAQTHHYWRSDDYPDVNYT